MKLFADDTKLYRVVDSQEDANLLQEDLDQMVEWSHTWQLPFNDRKCKVMHYGKKKKKENHKQWKVRKVERKCQRIMVKVKRTWVYC